MPQEIRLWEVTEDDELQAISSATLDLEDRLERWLEDDISILGLDLLVIGRQISVDFGGAVDLLCMDANGDLVVVELKRDRTPREVTSQVIEYASWVEDLGSRRVMEIADRYFGDEGALEQKFGDAFGEELPETLNEQHRMLVVGARLDPRTERIIQYLSDQHGVNINAVTFQLFESARGNEILGRVFFLEPAEVDRRERTRQSSKRRRRPTRDELRQRADEAGKGELFRELVDSLTEVFSTRTPRVSFLTLRRPWQRADAGRSSFLNLYPDEPEDSEGVRFTLYTGRVGDAFDLEEDRVVEVLPGGVEDWRYQDTDEQEEQWKWAGHTGVFTSVGEADRLVEFLVDSSGS